MQTDPLRLIDESIAQLSHLHAVLANEIRGETVLSTQEQKACEEAVERIGGLIPTLRVARRARIAPLPMRVSCIACED